ncbi:hypothetical protein QBC37DRAFT_379640 [Rhypophila decipiens]|uniref:F-box domain-containing protein n=1 Tax=Rhypophila decipiens TaxID=261697 RepID=A0AAN6Y1Z4_9PEZI|nr:hypothetical protein QBC37DRAFT_379640 [Rhypophila decipiens]
MADPFSKVPNEIILEIAKYVPQDDDIAYYELGRDMPDKPIINFGMVCRRFREMSAHLLVPSVRVACHTSSLQRLEEISHHPLVRKGVRKLIVSLSSFDKELCDDFGQFIKFYMFDFERYCKEGGRRQDERETERVLKSWREVFDLFEYNKSHGRRGDHSKEYATQRTLLEEAHANYKQLHDEQEHLFRSGEFTDRVTLATSRMPLVKSLTFVDNPLHQGRDLWDPPVRPGVDVRDA